MLLSLLAKRFHVALGELAATLITFSISSLCWKVWRDQERKITGAGLLFANPRAAGLQMHRGPVRPRCVIPPQPSSSSTGNLAISKRESGHCLCFVCAFHLGVEKWLLSGWAQCLHDLIPAGSVPGDAADEADGRNSQLHSEQGCRWSRKVLLQEQQWLRRHKGSVL